MDEVKKENTGYKENELTESELGYVAGGLEDLLNKKKEEKKEKFSLPHQKTFDEQLNEIGSYLN